MKSMKMLLVASLLAMSAGMSLDASSNNPCSLSSFTYQDVCVTKKALPLRKGEIVICNTTTGGAPITVDLVGLDSEKNANKLSFKNETDSNYPRVDIQSITIKPQDFVVLSLKVEDAAVAKSSLSIRVNANIHWANSVIPNSTPLAQPFIWTGQ